MPPGVIIVAPTIVRCTIKAQLFATKACANIVDVSVDEFGISREEAVGFVVPKVMEAWQDNILSQMVNGYVVTGMHYIDLDSTDGVSGEQAPIGGHPTAGTASGNPTSTNVSYLIHKPTSALRSSRSGRMYLPCPIETEIDGLGTITGSRVTSMNSAVQALKTEISDIGGIIAGTVAWRVVHIDKHRPSGGPPTDPSVWTWYSTDMGTPYVDPIVATQRRRLRN